MEYEFSIDESHLPEARFSSGHEAFGCWFSDELGNNVDRIDALVHIVNQLESKTLFRHSIKGKSFSIHLDRDHVEVVANAIDVEDKRFISNEDAQAHAENDDAALPDSTDFYDEELQAECGLPDFKDALLGWQSFLFL